MTNIAVRQNKTPTQQVIKIKHYKLKTGKGELNSTSRNHLCGLLLGNLPKETLPVNFQSRRSDAIADRDILLSQIGLLCNGRTDFNDIDLYRGDEVFVNAYRLKAVASESVFRQRFDDLPAQRTHAALRQLNTRLLSLRNLRVPFRGSVKLGLLHLAHLFFRMMLNKEKLANLGGFASFSMK